MQMEREINKCETSLLNWWEVLQLESLKIRCKQSLQHLPASIVKDITLSDQTENLMGKNTSIIKLVIIYFLFIIRFDFKEQSLFKHDQPSILLPYS